MNKTSKAVQNGVLYQIRQKYGVTCDTDTYKQSHHPLYPTGATRMMSYIESRGGEYDKVLNIGTELICQEYLLQPLTKRQAKNMVNWAKKHFNGNDTEALKIALDTVVNEYNGMIPIIIRNAPEGLMIPTKNVLITIETSVPDTRIFSLVSYFETKLLRVWNSMTLGTKSMYMREKILAGLNMTSDIPEVIINFMLHDFGSRGTTSMEQAAFGGMSHLVAFRGSDTSVAIMAAEIAHDEGMAGFSIPASEHSVTTANKTEIDLVDKMFRNFAKPGAIFATVIDSRNTLKFIREIAPMFKQRLIESGAHKWVFRPDSGDPVKMPIKCVEELDLIFGHAVNSKGFKVLNGVGVIQGDGITPKEVDEIMETLISKGWCVSNIAFGMGGGLHQKHDRDTLKFSMKCSAIEIDGVWYDVYKSPAVFDENWNVLEEASFKLSKKGRLTLVRNIHTNEFKTVRVNEVDTANWVDVMQDVFANGEMKRRTPFSEIRRNAGTL